MLCRQRAALEALVAVSAVSLLRLAVAAPRREAADCQPVARQDSFLWEDAWGAGCAGQPRSAGAEGAVAAHTDSPRPLAAIEATGNASKCDEDQIVIHLHRLQAITPESIVLLVTEQDLDELCGQVRDSLDALAQASAACAALGDDDHDVYQALVRGVATLHADLCGPAQPSRLRERFLQHSACLRNLSEALQECAGPRDWTGSGDERAVCGTYERIATCYHSATAVACGSQAADLMRQLVVSVATSVLGNVRCKEMEQLEQPQQINELPEPEHSSFSPHLFSVSIIVLMLCTTFDLYG